MRRIPPKLRQELDANPEYHKCALRPHGCYGRIQWHHHIIHAGKQLNEAWAIVAICEGAHNQVSPITSNALRGGTCGDLDRFVLNRATTEELQAVSKSVDYVALRDRQNKEHGN